MKPAVRQEGALQALGQRLAAARRARGQTQADLATDAGLGLSTIVALEAGKPGVAIGNLVRALDALGMLEQLDQLLHPGRDEVMLQFAVDNLPRRARAARRRR
jgi:transcriptional regulator with XRE-family HTH domain